MTVVRRCAIILGFEAHLILRNVAKIAVVHPVLDVVRCSSLPLVHVLLLLVVAVPVHRSTWIVWALIWEMNWVRCVAILEVDAIVLLIHTFLLLFYPASLVLGQKRSRVLVRIGKLANSIIIKVGCTVISLGRLKILLRKMKGMVGKILFASLTNALL